MGPRGSLKLIGALVQPSGEDQLMFCIVPQQGEPYKLKARTAKDRQLWVDRVRRVVERHTIDVNTLVKAAAASMPRDHPTSVPDNMSSLSRSSFRKSKRERTKPVHSKREIVTLTRREGERDIVISTRIERETVRLRWGIDGGRYQLEY
eukprot:sb/3473650/